MRRVRSTQKKTRTMKNVKILQNFATVAFVAALTQGFYIQKLAQTDVQNGKLDCSDEESCFLDCNFGYVAIDKRIYNITDTDIEAKAKCVEIMALLIGGVDEDSKTLSSIEIFSSDESMKSKAISDFPYPVESPVALWVHGRVLVCGGVNGNNGGIEEMCWSYNPCNDSWSPEEAMIFPRSLAVGVVTFDDRPWILGGKDSLVDFTSSELWNKTEHGDIEWANGPDLESGKTGHCGSTKKNGKIAIITGGKNSMKTVESFNLEDDTHVFSPDLNSKRANHGCATLSSALGEAVVVAGGNNEFLLPVDTSDIFSPFEMAWKEGPQLPKPRAGASMAIIDGQATLIGGHEFNHYFLDAVALVEIGFLKYEWQTINTTLSSPRINFGLAEVPVTLFDSCGLNFKRNM